MLSGPRSWEGGGMVRAEVFAGRLLELRLVAGGPDRGLGLARVGVDEVI